VVDEAMEKRVDKECLNAVPVRGVLLRVSSKFSEVR
jgi:hypothetical protein